MKSQPRTARSGTRGQALKQRDVGATEFVDRLLAIADRREAALTEREHLAGSGTTLDDSLALRAGGRRDGLGPCLAQPEALQNCERTLVGDNAAAQAHAPRRERVLSQT